jgi:hypothetical protein
MIVVKRPRKDDLLFAKKTSSAALVLRLPDPAPISPEVTAPRGKIASSIRKIMPKSPAAPPSIEVMFKDHAGQYYV